MPSAKSTTDSGISARTAAVLAAIRTELPDLPVVQELVSFIESSRRGTLSAHRGLRDASRYGGATAEAVEVEA